MSSDSEVIRRSREDPASFSALFDRHAQAVHRYLSRRAGADVADDVVSETFMVAFRQRDRFDLDAASALPWLLGIATNTLNAHRRAEARHLRTLAKSAVVEGDDGGLDGVANRADASRDVRRIAALLRSMSDGDRDVLLLHAWADLSGEEIADVLHIPVGTVRSRLFRARRQLRAVLRSDKESDHGRTDAAATA